MHSICVHVIWAWLSYLAVVVGLAIIFQTLLMVQNPSSSQVKVWKSSSLALLFCSVDEIILQRTRIDQTKNELSQVANTTSAQLLADDEGKAVLRSRSKAGRVH